MRYVKIFVVITILSVIMSGCIFSNENDTEKKQYYYTAYDSLGQPMVQGSLTLAFRDSGRIEGTWELSEIRKVDYRGPQVGSGKLVGEIKNDTIWINLTPQYIDNNVSLSGVLAEKTITGRWSWITFIGITSSGVFTANEK